MNKDTINRTIAEAVGWKYHPFGGGWQKPGDEKPDRSNTPPLYTDCLNACAEMEREIIIPLESPDYYHELERIIERDRSVILRGNAELGFSGWLIHATALQRAEAFLRTLNLWTPTGEENE